MRARKHDDIERIRRRITRVRRWSDRVVGIGPFGIGLDGLVAFLPGVGAIYSLGAGALLLHQANQAHAHPAVMARMAAMVLADSVLDVIPIPLAPAVADLLFTGHKWAADALLKHMDETVYYPGSRVAAQADRHFQEEQLVLQAEGRRPRVVYLDET